jgi:TM2 domain-containing membrane protein YozV
MENHEERTQAFTKVLLWSLTLPLVGILIVILYSVFFDRDHGIDQAYYDNIVTPNIVRIVVITFVIPIITFIMWIAAQVANRAAKKGRSYNSFFVLTLFFPLIMWLVVSSISADASQATAGTKKCPKCAEYVKVEATLCKHCGSELAAK